jgi:hypothetical protein
MTSSAKKAAAEYALVAAVVLSIYGFGVFAGSLHGPTAVEKIEIAVAFPALALAYRAGVFPNSDFLFWLLGLAGFAFWFVVFWCLGIALLSRRTRASDV